MHALLTLVASVGDKCTPGGGGFLGFPHWYKYLPGIEVFSGSGTSCIPKMEALSDVWLVVAAIIEIMLRLAGLAAIAFIIYGGFQYISSRGEPDKTSKALQTIINALVGLTIAISATILVTFVAGRFR